MALRSRSKENGNNSLLPPTRGMAVKWLFADFRFLCLHHVCDYFGNHTRKRSWLLEELEICRRHDSSNKLLLHHPTVIRVIVIVEASLKKRLIQLFLRIPNHAVEDDSFALPPVITEQGGQPAALFYAPPTHELCHLPKHSIREKH